MLDGLGRFSWLGRLARSSWLTRSRRPRWLVWPASVRADLAVAAACLAGAVYITWGMWQDPNRLLIKNNQGDQALFEWLLAYTAHTATHLGNPWWTTMLNHPLGVNLAVNTSQVLVGTVMAPITLAFGPPAAFLTVLTLNLALTPYAWYYVLSRHVTRTRAGAALGGLFCGFAPAVVSHANSHLNFTAGYVLPFLILRFFRLGEPDRQVRNGVIFGLLVVVQYTLGAEMLFFVGLALLVAVLAWASQHREQALAKARPFLTALAAAGAVTMVVLAYPMYLQFAGAQRFSGTGFNQYAHSEYLASFVAVPYLSVARMLGFWRQLAPNFTEENSFFGPSLVVVIVAAAAVLWRRQPLVRLLAVLAAVFAVLSLGPALHVTTANTGIMLPYRALMDLPLFDSALPSRLAMILIPIIAVVLGLAMDRAATLQPTRRRAWYVAIALGLVPLLPLPLPTIARAPVPAFFTDGTYRQYVRPGETLVPIPPASDLNPDGQRWQDVTGFTFAIPAGFFLGPGGPDGRGQVGPVQRPTYQLFTVVATKGWQPIVTDGMRQQAQADLAYWHASVIVLDDGGPGSRWTTNQAKLLEVATELFGTPQRVDGVWLWQVNPAPPSELASGR